MAKQTINLGSGPDSYTGDSLNVAFTKINENFTDLYSGNAAGNIRASGNIIANTSLRTDGSILGQTLEIIGNAVVLGTISANNFTYANGVAVGDLSGSNISTTGNIGANTITANSFSGNGNFIDVTISGNLQVNGTTNFIDVTRTTIEDPLIEIGGNAAGGSLTSNDNKDRGLIFHYYSGAAKDAFLGLDVSTGEIRIASNAIVVNNEVLLYDTYANVRAGYFIGNGSQLTGITSYANSNVTAYAEAGWSGNIIPSANVAYSLGSSTNQWQDLWVSNATIFMNSVPLSLNADNTLLVNNTPVVTFVNGNLSVGGNVVNGSVQPYLELTNDPFILQPAVLGEPVAVTAAAQGSNARFTVVIGEGPTLDSITVTTAGTGYTVGQIYRIWSYYIGGPNDISSIEFEVETVDESGGILTIINAAFLPGASNYPGTYTNTAPELRPSVFDVIDTGITLTRGRNQGLYNSESEQFYDNNEYDSPVGTLWNNDGWDDLLGLAQRNYTTWRLALNNQVGNNILGAELVMWDTINDKYYKFDFTAWGENNGAFAYTRTEVTDPNYFRKTDYGSEIDIILEDDGNGAGIGITRGENNSIYNPYREEGYNQSTSPDGTLWNTDGWDDLSNVATRTYSAFYAAYGGNLGNRVPGSKAVMYVPDNGKYYAVEWFSWTQGGNGGGFSYYRRELDLTKLDQGVKFADGSVLKTAQGLGPVKLTAPGNRRIEEVAGFKQVSVTAVNTVNLTTTASRSVVGDARFWVLNANTTIDDIVNNPSNYGIVDSATIQFSLDNNTWYTYTNGYSGTGTETGVDTNGSHTYNEGDTIYFRYNTGGAPQVWWDKADLPGGSANFRGAVIDYHAYSGQATWIGTIHIVADSGYNYITHTEINSGTSDAENDDLWVVQDEGTISYRRIDGEAKTLKIQWTAKVFYGSEFYD